MCPTAISSGVDISEVPRCHLLQQNSFHLIKQNRLLKFFGRTLDDLGILLRVFPSRTDLKLHNISVTPKMVKKVLMNLDSSVFQCASKEL